MTTSMRDEVRRELEALQRDFLQDLPARLEELRNTCCAAFLAQEDMALWQRVVAQAHALSGTAGVLGLAAINRAAAELESAFETKIGSAPVNDDFVARANYLIDALRTCLVEPSLGTAFPGDA